MTALEVLIIELAAAEKTANEAEETYKVEKAKFDRQLDPFRIEMQDRRAAVQALRDKVQAEALKSENKSPHPAVAVVNVTEFAVDADQAQQWCVVHMPALLSINLGAYLVMRRAVYESKKLSALMPDMPGEPQEHPAIRIAGDLAPYLPPSKEEVVTEEPASSVAK